MTYEEARDWLDNVSRHGDCLGLERMRILMEELGNPQDRLRFIHIAGTNGKGSVMTYLERTLSLAGYRVGRYLSPALFCYEEKMRVNEVYISREEVALTARTVRDACEKMVRDGKDAPTIFEVETAMAFCFFLQKDCDLVLLETGMGGETDATNVVRTTILEIFSSISLDHMEFLGDTVEKIASVKAGILKEGSLAVSDMQSPGVEEVLAGRAGEMKIPVAFVDAGRISNAAYALAQQTFTYTTAGIGAGILGERAAAPRRWENMKISMPGTWQVRNACTALEAVEALRLLGYRLDEAVVRSGFESAVIGGRFEVVCREPLIIMDGAHNPEAALRLKESILAYFPEAERAGRKLYFVMGVFADKDYTAEIALTAPLADEIITVQTGNHPRALAADALAREVLKVNPNTVCGGSVAKGLEMALERAGREDVLILFGSLSWLGEAREYLKSRVQAQFI